MDIKNKFYKLSKKDLYLETKNLILRPFKESDAKDLVENYKDKVYSKNISNFPYPYTLKEAKKFIKSSNNKLKSKTKPKLEFAVFLKKENRVIGGISIKDIDFKQRNAESGSCISKDYWGTGYIYEAKLEIYNFVFKKLNFVKLFSYVMIFNIRSKKHLEKLGFKEQGIFRKDHFHKGKFQDIYYLELLKEEFKYKKLKKKLLN
jgi:RimJ/RimL family protein N-acetyltransferase